MADRVVLFGPDTCYRLLLLRSVGYLAHQCQSVAELGLLLQERADTDVILIGEKDRKARDDAVTLARSYSIAPLILLDDLNIGEPEEQFECIIRPLTPPEVLLRSVAATIAHSRALLANSAALRERSALLLRHCQLLRQRSAYERARAAKARAEMRRLLLGIDDVDVTG